MTSLISQLQYARDALRSKGLDWLQRQNNGEISPRYGERIWIETKQCTMSTKKAISRRKSGRIMGGEWDDCRTPVAELPKISYCLDHWCGGLSWEEAGAYEYMQELIRLKSGRVDGLLTIEDIIARFKTLDGIYLQVKAENQLKTAADAKGIAFRESGGIYMHIGRDGTPLFGNAGHHRLAIALALELPFFPAQLGLVHAQALASLPKFRENPGGDKS